MSRIYMGNTALTNNIQDADRAALAYNMFRSMAEAKVSVTADGTKQAIDGAALRLVDENGVSTIPEPDKEWFGTEEDKAEVRESVLDEIIAEMEEEGEEPDRDFERSMMDEYTVSYRSQDITTTYFMGSSWDIDKVRDIYSILDKDLSSDISLSVFNEFEDMDVNITENMDHLNVVDMEGDVYDPEKDIDDSMDFDDAVAAISQIDNGIEM